MSDPISLEVVIERLDSVRAVQEDTNNLIREHIAEDRNQFAEIRTGLSSLQTAVHLETARREGHSVAIAALESTRVTNDRFEPVRLIVYGMVAVIMVGVLGAIVALTLKGTP